MRKISIPIVTFEYLRSPNSCNHLKGKLMTILFAKLAFLCDFAENGKNSQIISVEITG